MSQEFHDIIMSDDMYSSNIQLWHFVLKHEHHLEMANWKFNKLDFFCFLMLRCTSIHHPFKNIRQSQCEITHHKWWIAALKNTLFLSCGFSKVFRWINQCLMGMFCQTGLYPECRVVVFCLYVEMKTLYCAPWGWECWSEWLIPMLGSVCRCCVYFENMSCCDFNLGCFRDSRFM